MWSVLIGENLDTQSIRQLQINWFSSNSNKHLSQLAAGSRDSQSTQTTVIRLFWAGQHTGTFVPGDGQAPQSVVIGRGTSVTSSGSSWPGWDWQQTWPWLAQRCREACVRSGVWQRHRPRPSYQSGWRPRHVTDLNSQPEQNFFSSKHHKPSHDPELTERVRYLKPGPLTL